MYTGVGGGLDFLDVATMRPFKCLVAKTRPNDKKFRI